MLLTAKSGGTSVQFKKTFFLFLCVRILYLNKKVPVAFGGKKKTFLGWGLWNLNVTHKTLLENGKANIYLFRRFVNLEEKKEGMWF